MVRKLKKKETLPERKKRKRFQGEREQEHPQIEGRKVRWLDGQQQLWAGKFFPPFLLIGVFSVVRKNHINNFPLLINVIEITIVSYPIAPGFGVVVNKFFDVFAEERVCLQLRVNVTGELDFDFLIYSAKLAIQIL